MVRLFTYGSLREADIRRTLLGGRPEGRKDTLADHALSHVRDVGVDYITLVPAAGQTVDGEVLDVHPDELRRIDEYESEGYVRRRVELSSGITAWAYFRE